MVISKILSANDTGDTGAHQAGICVPKQSGILDFFPSLGVEEKNPRFHLSFYDDEGMSWEFAFIYYNNKFFGGTRNEYRLTRMTPFIKQNGLAPGDELILEKNDHGRRSIRFRRKRSLGMGEDGVLRLGSDWKVIRI